MMHGQKTIRLAYLGCTVSEDTLHGQISVGIGKFM
jgi:hypothetical protein